jgi:uncharacterized protein DUF3142
MGGKRLLLLALVALLAGSPAAPPPALAAPDAIVGQWVWTRADADVFRAAVAERTDLRPVVHVATVTGDARGRVVRRRALSPAVLADGRPVGIVIRFEDSFHRVWDRDPADVAEEVAHAIDATLVDVRATGVELREIELDYDAPVRRLAAWAEVLRVVARRMPAPLWVTSIPSHLGDPAYGERLRGVVAGHILQLFDTGTACTAEARQELATQLAAHALPYRLGLAAFERRGAPGRHACWNGAARDLGRAPGAAGQMIFPAGHPITGLLAADDLGS